MARIKVIGANSTSEPTERRYRRRMALYAITSPFMDPTQSPEPIIFVDIQDAVQIINIEPEAVS